MLAVDSGEADQQKFMAGLDGLTAKEMSESFQTHVLEKGERLEREQIGTSEWLPLSVWGQRGFDTAAIKERSRPENIRPHDLFGLVYRVSLSSERMVHTEFTLRTDSARVKAPLTLSPEPEPPKSPEQLAIANEPHNTDQSSSGGGSSSNSSSESSSDAKKKRSKKSKKGKKSKDKKKNEKKKQKRSKKEQKKAKHAKKRAESSGSEETGQKRAASSRQDGCPAPNRLSQALRAVARILRSSASKCSQQNVDGKFDLRGEFLQYGFERQLVDSSKCVVS